MTLRVDDYLARTFDLATSNCWHLVRDAWRDLTGVDLGERTPERLTVWAITRRFEADAPTFEELARPCEPCIVLMTHPGTVPHVGVFTRGRVLQMTQLGASYMPLRVACLGFTRVRFLR